METLFVRKKRELVCVEKVGREGSNDRVQSSRYTSERLNESFFVHAKPTRLAKKGEKVAPWDSKDFQSLGLGVRDSCE